MMLDRIWRKFVNSKYRLIFIITFLLLLLSVSLSFVNYVMTLASTREHLREASLPLSTDNIYNKIQTHLIEPNLVASMMAQDTFLRHWLVNEEEDKEKIKDYLESIKNKYKMSTVFVASQSTQNYYLARGFVEKMKVGNPTNAWYYEFRDKAASHEVNIDFNKNINNSMFMFINHKIFDEKFHMLGATGVGIKISYINDMLKRFREDYKFKVFFADKRGELILYERNIIKFKNLQDDATLNQYKEKLLSNRTHTIKFQDTQGDEHLIHSKYIPELDLYLLVQAKVSDFTVNVVRTFYMNLALSLLVTVMILFIFVKMVNRHNRNLEKLANYDMLTDLPNRRVFSKKIKHLLLLNKRESLRISFLFFDIDDFKKVNDNFGHDIGDAVLIRIAQIIKKSVRESDLYARWGGEEFVIAFVKSSLSDSEVIANKLRVSIQDDKELFSLVNYKITASFGVTDVHKGDTLQTLLKRVDNYLYRAKGEGKNRVMLK